MPKLKTVREVILLAHANRLIDDDECLLLYDLNRSSNLDLRYNNYEKFDLDLLNEDDCKSEFRFCKGDIYRLCDVFELPDKVRCYNGVVVQKEEALCIFLKRFAYPCRYQDVMFRFGRPVPQICMISNHILNVIYENWGFLLSNMQQNWLSRQNLELFANIVHEKGAPLDNCWGFVDGTTRPVSRPGQHQRVLYNGHKRYHCIKFQSVVAPNGLVANLYGPVEGRRHDSGMLADSGLFNQLRQHSFDRNNQPLCIYGDPAYPLRVHLQSGFKGANITQDQKLWNTRMSSVRVSVEWVFGDIINFFKFMDFKKNLKIGMSPVAKMYIVCALLHNARCCFYGSITSNFFDCEPPIIEEYFTH